MSSDLDTGLKTMGNMMRRTRASLAKTAERGVMRGISIDDRDEIDRRAAEARAGTAGVPWEELKRELLK